MKKYCCFILFWLPLLSFSQPVTEKLTNAINLLQTDVQFKHASLSMYVVESKTGKIIVDKNAEPGMAPASCKKLNGSAASVKEKMWKVLDLLK